MPAAPFTFRVNGRPISMTPRLLPEGCTPFPAADFECFGFRSGLVTGILQIRTTSFCTVIYLQYFAHHEIQLSCTVAAQLAGYAYLMEGSAHITTGATTMPLARAMIALFHLATTPSTVNARAEGQVSLLCALYAPAKLGYALSLFSGLEHLSKRFHGHEPTLIAFGPLNSFYDNTEHLSIIAPLSVPLLDNRVCNEQLFRILQMINDAVSKEQSLKQKDVWEKMKAWIDEHLQERPPTSKLARLFGVSNEMIRTYCASVFGRSLRSYYTEKALEMAALQLQHTREPVKRIARGVGYKKANNFSAAFKKRYGCSPLQWRLRQEQ